MAEISQLPTPCVGILLAVLDDIRDAIEAGNVNALVVMAVYRDGSRSVALEGLGKGLSMLEKVGMLEEIKRTIFEASVIED